MMILGNGFSIDFIQQINKTEVVDVKNLFRLGHSVKFPHTNMPGFLSHKYCPSLWLLGARPNKNGDDNMSIIEEIITCSNMLFEYLTLADTDKNRLKLFEKENQSIYIKAYSELIAYLRHLFIDYNNKISDDEISRLVQESQWGWIKFFKKAFSDSIYDQIYVITYNYDIWLERILDTLKIEYNICGCEGKKAKINIVKPHGSISFIPKNGKNKIYEINYQIDSSGVDISQIEVGYTELGDYDKSFLIPPAGDSQRRQPDAWATKLRECAVNAVKEIKEFDDVFVCGMSYWHVDRKELDELLINLNQQANITLVNPDPPKELNAVLVSLFKNYTAYASSNAMGEVMS
jgi:hypothetical protein